MYQELEQLFFRGELEQCIAEGEKYLLSDPQDEEVLFLMAVASHDEVYDEGHEAVYQAIKEKVIPYLRRILKINPNHQKALYNMLSYPLDNEYTLMQIARPQKHITEENKAEFISYAERLLHNPDNRGYGHDFLVKIYESLNDDEQLLKSLDDGISYFRTESAESREWRDRNASLFWIKKIYLLDRSKTASGKELTDLIGRELKTFVSRNEYDFINLADIAFENGATDLSLQVLLKLIKGKNTAVYIHEKLAEWRQRFNELIQNGYHHPDVLYYQLIIERNYPEELHLEEDFYYRHALEIMETFPEHFAGYHFAGTFLYEAGRYAEAVPLLEKAFHLSSNATAWRRKTESQYHLDGTIPTEAPEFSDDPSDIYNEAVHFDHFMEEKVEDDNDTIRFLELNRKVYQRSYEAFQKYFDENKFDSDYYNDLHTRAMCCNNLAIKYALSGDSSAMTALAEEGLNYSEFRELHLVLIDGLLDKGNHDATLAAMDTYFNLYDEEAEDTYYKNLYYRARQAEIRVELDETGSKEEAEELLTFFYRHTEGHPEISDYDFRDLEAAKSVLEIMIYQDLEKENDLTRTRYYEAIAENFPHEPNPQYILMQIYNEQENYEKVNSAAGRYLENKKDFMLDPFDQAKSFYMMVKSCYILGRYTEAAALFDQNDASNAQAMDPEDYILWLSYGIRLHAKSNDKKRVLQLEEKFSEIYRNEGWEYDQMMEEIQLAKALVLYQAGDLKEAHSVLDHVMSFDGYDPVADEYKKIWKKPGLLSRFGF
ncbi:MAG: hypothetical protein LBE92_12430 [Chryseobacterium sp.]|jgi:tetratricopeptide (TPR) repeat protein|uniref:hypothetical protein n=1 Tax=Chryseobacterium sp. TaxID=1871047 RepID=UPI002825AC0D|nr:hypothetical protein [Chryseobacterium sp.]MDR2236919.1 hypothetical protein [Chryseobacterium sp.]